MATGESRLRIDERCVCWGKSCSRQDGVMRRRTDGGMQGCAIQRSAVHGEVLHGISPLWGGRRCTPRAGMCARRRTCFLCFAKESRQRMATRPRRPSLARGVRCGLARRGERRNSPPAGAQTSALDGAARRDPVALRSSPPPTGRATPFGSLRVASVGHQLSVFVEATRSEPRRGSCSSSFFPYAAPRSAAVRGCGAQRRRAQMSEPRRGEFLRPPRAASTAGNPSRQRGAPHPGRLSLVPFFGEAKKGTALPGAHPGTRRAAPHAPQGRIPPPDASTRGAPSTGCQSTRLRLRRPATRPVSVPPRRAAPSPCRYAPS